MNVLVASSGFVDVHTHVVPSGDDGARSLEEGLELCAEAARSGTTLAFATPHMQAPTDLYPWSARRERLFESAFTALAPEAAQLGLELRRGREVYPTEVHHVDLDAVRLEGTDAVLLEFPGLWLDVDDALTETWRACERVTEAGLTPLVAHPERCAAIIARPELLARFVEQGWPICLNGGSLLGDHGRESRCVAGQLLDRGLVSLVASDAHNARRPAALDRVHDELVARVGRGWADRLLDGSAVPGLVPVQFAR